MSVFTTDFIVDGIINSIKSIVRYVPFEGKKEVQVTS